MLMNHSPVAKTEVIRIPDATTTYLFASPHCQEYEAER